MRVVLPFMEFRKDSNGERRLVHSRIEDSKCLQDKHSDAAG